MGLPAKASRDTPEFSSSVRVSLRCHVLLLLLFPLHAFFLPTGVHPASTSFSDAIMQNYLSNDRVGACPTQFAVCDTFQPFFENPGIGH